MNTISVVNRPVLLNDIFPVEILLHIWNYVEPSIKMWITKYDYERYHSIYITPKTIPRFESFMRTVLRDKSMYLLITYLKENFKYWEQKKNWKYMSKTYPNYLYYLMDIAQHLNNKEAYETIKYYPIALEDTKEKRRQNKKNNKLYLDLNKRTRYKYSKWTN